MVIVTFYAFTVSEHAEGGRDCQVEVGVCLFVFEISVLTAD